MNDHEGAGEEDSQADEGELQAFSS